jgi:hypothetical protein
MPEQSRHARSRQQMGDPGWAAGTPVEVRNRFDRSWSSGFEVAEESNDGDVRTYRLRRRSDRAVLPAAFPSGELRLDADIPRSHRRQR